MAAMDTLSLQLVGSDSAEGTTDERHDTSRPAVQTSLLQAPETELDRAVGEVLGEEFVGGGYIIMPSLMPSFRQTGAPAEVVSARNFGTSKKPCVRPVTTRIVPGMAVEAETHAPMWCPECGCALEGNGSTTITLQHLPSGMYYSRLSVSRRRLRCPKCGWSCTLDTPFKAEGHHVTVPLYNFVCDMLMLGHTNKDVSLMTGLGQGTVKEIDKERLRGLYTEVRDGKRVLRRPEAQSRLLGIDEFKLHNGHRYATVIIDLETGHVLWLAHGKKKAVVYEFCDFVGEGWLSGVEAVACDMNSDYEEAFRERNPAVKIVFDHFHIVKNLNEGVISEVRKDEVRRLREAGEEEAAKELKGTKYILMSTQKTRERRDDEAAEQRVLRKGSELFNTPEVRRTHGATERYEELISQNKLLLTCDIVKEKLEKAYGRKSVGWMRRDMNDIVEICRGTENKHFEWFANLIESHIEGIVTYAKYKISSGKVEGTNQMIKTLRRRGYGYPDDEYMFLKIFDASRRMSSDRELAS